MAKRGGGFFNDTNRGVDAIAYKARFTARTMVNSFLLSLLTALVVSGLFLFVLWWQRPWIITYGEACFKSAVVHVLSYLPVGNKNPSWLTVVGPDGQQWAPTPVEAALAPEFKDSLLKVAKTGGWIWIISFPMFVIIGRRYGRRLGANRLERGLEIVNAKKIIRLIPRKQRGDYRLCDVPLPKGSEKQHIIIIGAPGTGKSLILADLQEQVRRRNEKAIIYDPTGEFYALFAMPGDHLLNPLNRNSEHWTPWAEIRQPYDADTIATSLIPVEANSDPFWANAARSFLAAALDRIPAKERTVERLIDYLCTTDLSELARLVPGTDAAALLSADNPRTALSVQATVSQATRSLRYLWAGGRQAFPIRDWLARQDDNSWLFLGAPADQQAALRPLLTCWLECFATAALSLPPSRERRIIVVIDELPTLHKLDAIPRLLAQGRKYGVSGFLGMQNYAQLQGIYGSHGANAIAGLCSTWLTLRVPDAESAEWASKNLGEIDITETQEAFTYGAGNYRDGLRLSEIRKPRPVVSATQIQQLPDLEGYLRLAGPYPVTQVKVPLVKRQPIHPLHLPVDESQTVYRLLRDLPPTPPHNGGGKPRRKK